MTKTHEFLAGIEKFLAALRTDADVEAYFAENIAQQLVYQADVTIECKIMDIARACHQIFCFLYDSQKIDGFETMCEKFESANPDLWQLDEDLNELCSDIDEALYDRFISGDLEFESDFDLFSKFFAERDM